MTTRVGAFDIALAFAFVGKTERQIEANAQKESHSKQDKQPGPSFDVVILQVCQDLLPI